MTTDIPELAAYALLNFFQNFDVLLLVMVRLLAFIMLVPVLAGATIPTMPRVMLAFSLAYMVFSAGVVGEITYFPTVPVYGQMILVELVAGLMMGFMVYMAFAIIYFAGQIIDYQIGFMMASLFDPISQIQVPVVGNLLFFTMMALFVVSGGLSTFIAAVVLSYEIAPVGQIFVLENNTLLLYAASMFSVYLRLGLQFALPIAGSLFIVNVMLGILVKAVPQMNVFVVGMPLKTLLGLSIMWFTMPVFAIYYIMIYEFAEEMLMAVVGGLRQ
ncbi:MAG: flagellar biosynthetic protein FliR [Defluviitaleaceae bacterium]|nr:flagellar biosynthetic protein FliR [Defluviitaleaceae bacterium]